jgi:hypothetical protein
MDFGRDREEEEVASVLSPLTKMAIDRGDRGNYLF